MATERRSGRDQSDILRAKTIIGGKVVNMEGEILGHVEEIMIEVGTGRADYAVLSLEQLFRGMANRLFPVPWELLYLDPEKNRFILALEKERLKTAPGFEKNDWPRMSDREWDRQIRSFYRQHRRRERGPERRSGSPGRRSEDRTQVVEFSDRRSF